MWIIDFLKIPLFAIATFALMFVAFYPLRNLIFSVWDNLFWLLRNKEYKKWWFIDLFKNVVFIFLYLFYASLVGVGIAELFLKVSG